MSTRIHKKVPLPPPFHYLGEHLTHLAPGSELRIRSTRNTIIYFLAGEARLSIDKGEPVSIHEGDIVIVPGPSNRVYFSETPATLHHYTLSFFTPLPRLRPTASPQEKELIALMKSTFAKSAVLNGHGASVRQRLLSLRHELDNSDAGSSILIFSAVLNLTVETAHLSISRQGQQDAKPGRRKGRSLVNGSLEYMLRNLKNNPSIESLAWALKVSTEHLCRSFRNELGTTPRMALRELQVDEAKSLLINSPLEIYRVAEETGFPSATTFCRFFRNTTGMTPTEYRAANRGNFESSKSLNWRAPAERAKRSAFAKSQNGKFS